jgi:hypothetical protein
MSTHGAAHDPGMTGAETDVRRRRLDRTRHARTETKSAFKTTEMIAFVAVLAAVLISAAIDDDFGARAAWLYAVILTAGYMVSRGLAKSGSFEPRDDDLHD